MTANVAGSYFQTLRLAVRSLLLQKLRASLAALGIFIGTSTVIWLVAMGEGVSYQAQQQIKDLGATNIIVRSVKPPHDSNDNTGPMVRYGLLRADYDRILSNVPTITRAAPMREIQREIQVQDRMADVKLVGCTPLYRQLNGLQIARGRWMNSRDAGDNIVVLADETARHLFPYENPIGQSVRMGREIYVVIGQTKPRTAAAAIGGSLDARDFNRDAYIPLDTFRKRIGDMVFVRRSGTFGGETVELSQITLTVSEVEDVDATAAVVQTLLGKFHEKADYAVVVPKELLDQAEKTRAMFNVLLVVIAGISLAVGGIGIMNIMLATVTERTREIGIRRALGAKRKHIIGQFLSETIVLTAGGGILGVLFGLMCGPIFRAGRNLLTTISPETLPPIIQSIEPRVAPWSVVLALCISIGTGVVFGVYPARQAAFMDPIEALRHE
jgi:putative ABC transport system permease protein